MAGESAKKIYQLILDAMERKNLKHQRDDEKLSVKFDVSGEIAFLPMSVHLRVDEARKLIRLVIPFGFRFPEERRVDGALATCYITNSLAFGSFDYDISDGEIMFRMANPYENCDISADLIVDMYMYALATLHSYTESLFAISKGLMDVEDFLDGKRF